MKPLIWRQAAIDDAAEAASWYAGEGGLALELASIDALEMACRRIVEQPAMGSTRHANLFPQLPVPLRYLPLARFKRYLLYYVDLPDRVELIRVWDAARGLHDLNDNAD